MSILTAWVFINLVAEWTHELPHPVEQLSIELDQHQKHDIFPLHDYLCAACLLMAKSASMPAHPAMAQYIQECVLFTGPVFVPQLDQKRSHTSLRAPPFIA